MSESERETERGGPQVTRHKRLYWVGVGRGIALVMDGLCVCVAVRTAILN